MATDIVRINVTLKRSSGVPADNIVNTFWFAIGDNTNTDDAQAACERVRDFYIVNPTGEANNVFSQLGNLLSSSGHEVTAYYLSDPEPRVPRYELTFSGTTGTSSFPAEVAVVMSYSGPRTPGLPQARNRGRIYLGPIPSNTASVGGDLQVPSVTRTRITKAAQDLAGKNTVEVIWVIYSPTRAAAEIDYHPETVVGGWVDDRYDTQRRRGGDTTTRTTWGSV